MTDITLSDTQAEAVAQIKDWFKNRTAEQQVFRVFGYAGTGKTTITRHAIGELGLAIDGAEVLFGTFTGKAAYVMRQHGLPGQTIHSMTYVVSVATDEEIQKAEEAARKAEIEAALFSGQDRLEAEAEAKALWKAAHGLKKPSFGINEKSPILGCKLIVLDEVSMVGEEQATDLLSFKKPILVLGDPGQLPPIKGEGAFTQQKPDVMLTEIHRQAGESAIIRLATMARQGIKIPHGKHDEFVWKMRRDEVDSQMLLNGGQVICGKNATRFQLNNSMRRAAGYDTRFCAPTGPGEKIICLRNDNAKGLINGMFLTFDDVRPRLNKAGEWDGIAFEVLARCADGDGTFRCVTKRERRDMFDSWDDGPRYELHVEEVEEQRLDVYAGHFLDHIDYDEERFNRDYKVKRGLAEATFGWAITCHKAQGSQWENIIVWDDGLGRTETDRRRWLYTALTRAERGLVILD